MTIQRATQSQAEALVTMVTEWVRKSCKGAGGRTLFTVEAKKSIAKTVTSFGISCYEAAKILDEAGLQGEWKGNIRRWIEQEASGRLNIQNAVSVRSRIPTPCEESSTYRQLDALIAILLERGADVAEIQTVVARAIEEHEKRKAKVEAIAGIMATLREHDLTLLDLQ